jgi:hypothetical protein
MFNNNQDQDGGARKKRKSTSTKKKSGTKLKELEFKLPIKKGDKLRSNSSVSKTVTLDKNSVVVNKGTTKHGVKWFQLKGKTKNGDKVLPKMCSKAVYDKYAK